MDLHRRTIAKHPAWREARLARHNKESDTDPKDNNPVATLGVQERRQKRSAADEFKKIGFFFDDLYKALCGCGMPRHMKKEQRGRDPYSDTNLPPTDTLPSTTPPPTTTKNLQDITDTPDETTTTATNDIPTISTHHAQD
jgi:hypothetical protein